MDSTIIRHELQLLERTRRTAPLHCYLILKLAIIACKELRQQSHNSTAGTANNNLLDDFLKTKHYQNWIQPAFKSPSSRYRKYSVLSGTSYKTLWKVQLFPTPRSSTLAWWTGDRLAKFAKSGALDKKTKLELVTLGDSLTFTWAFQNLTSTVYDPQQFKQKSIHKDFKEILPSLSFVQCIHSFSYQTFTEKQLCAQN